MNTGLPGSFASIVLFFAAGCASAGEAALPTPTPSATSDAPETTSSSSASPKQPGPPACAQSLSLAVDGVASIPASQLRSYAVSSADVVRVEAAPDGRELRLRGRRPGNTVLALYDVAGAKRCVDVAVVANAPPSR